MHIKQLNYLIKTEITALLLLYL